MATNNPRRGYERKRRQDGGLSCNFNRPFVLAGGRQPVRRLPPKT
jgi:hypothetical protein